MTRKAVDLFHDYNSYRLLTGNVAKMRAEGKFVREFKINKKRLELFNDVQKWCEDQGIDPRVWIYHLFRTRRWMFTPQLLPGHLMSKKMVAGYHKLIEREYLDGYRAQLQKARPKDEYDPNRDLSNTVEATKRRYLSKDQSDRCLREMVSLTLGFHPKSEACQTCPRRHECQQRLESLVAFDIVALRNGDMTAEQARKEAHANAR